jgi:hypothetical protein
MIDTPVMKIIKCDPATDVMPAVGDEVINYVFGRQIYTDGRESTANPATLPVVPIIKSNTGIVYECQFGIIHVVFPEACCRELATIVRYLYLRLNSAQKYHYLLRERASTSVDANTTTDIESQQSGVAVHTSIIGMNLPGVDSNTLIVLMAALPIDQDMLDTRIKARTVVSIVFDNPPFNINIKAAHAASMIYVDAYDKYNTARPLSVVANFAPHDNCALSYDGYIGYIDWMKNDPILDRLLYDHAKKFVINVPIYECTDEKSRVVLMRAVDKSENKCHVCRNNIIHNYSYIAVTKDAVPQYVEICAICPNDGTFMINIAELYIHPGGMSIETTLRLKNYPEMIIELFVMISKRLYKNHTWHVDPRIYRFDGIAVTTTQQMTLDGIIVGDKYAIMKDIKMASMSRLWITDPRYIYI